jgi:MinD-like ATPase involved in chromosome partitioning or flagellar assembly
MFYETVLLDVGAGVTSPLARFAIERADHLVLVTTPDWIVSTIVLDALSQVPRDRTTVALNASHRRSAAVAALLDCFRAENLRPAVAIPYDEQLATMLDTATYTLDALERETRVAIKRLGYAVAEQVA